jgi:ribosomal protein S19E (S16A)
LSLPGFTRGGYIDENIQREAYRQAVDRLAIKEPPPLDRVFNYSITRSILTDLESKGWKPCSGRILSFVIAISLRGNRPDFYQGPEFIDNTFLTELEKTGSVNQV